MMNIFLLHWNCIVYRALKASYHLEKGYIFKHADLIRSVYGWMMVLIWIQKVNKIYSLYII